MAPATCRSSSPAVEHATLEEALSDGIKLEQNACLLCHGWTCAPLLMQFVAHFLKPLKAAARTVEELAQDTGATIGPLLLILRTCRILGYLRLDPDSQEYCTVQGAELDQLEKYLDPDSETTKALTSIYTDAVPPFRVPSSQATCCMSIWQAEHWSETASKTLAVMCDGAVLTPLLSSVTYHARYDDDGVDAGSEKLDRVDFRELDEDSRTVLGGIFEEIGVGQMDLEGVVTMTDKGSAALRKCYSYFTPTAFASVLADFYSLLFRETAAGNGYISAEGDLASRHISRLLSSRVHQQKLVHDMRHYIIPVFEEEDFSKQPSFLVDAGSSDAYLLSQIYECIKSETPRGKALEIFPVTIVCANSNDEILTAMKADFDKLEIPSVMISGDIGRPEDVTAALVREQIDVKKCLHVRAFAEQLRSCSAHAHEGFSEKSSASLFARASLGDCVHLDKHGALIGPVQSFAAIVDHFERWATALDGSFGMCVLEDMMLDVPTTARFFNDNISFAVEIVRALSRQYVVSPAAFALAAGMAGLFPRTIKNVRTYPRHGHYCRTMTQHLVKRQFRIRLAEKSDLKDLVRLEALTWDKHLQVSEKVLKRRLIASPTTVLVVTVEGNLVGVLYMQKIESLSSIDRQKLLYVHETHDPDGSVIQLISINLDPKYAAMSIGSELRAFALHLAHLDSSIKSVVAVTRCRDYHNYLGSLPTYVDSHTNGRLVDPILDFHTSYGAKVQRLVEGFRPEDTDNNGTGVLIQYHVNELMVPADDERISAKHPSSGSRSARGPRHKNGTVTVLSTYNTLKALLKEWGYEVDDDDPHRGFMDYGMDSVEIQTVRMRLSDMVGYELPVSMLLDYPSVISLSNHLDSLRGYVEDDKNAHVEGKEGQRDRLDSVKEEEEDAEQVGIEVEISNQDSASPRSLSEASLKGVSLAHNALVLAHGWTCGPLLLEFVASLLGPLRSLPGGATAAELARQTGASTGPLSIVLRTCAVLNYVAFDAVTRKYSLVEGMEMDELANFLDPSHPAADAVDSIYEEAPPPFRMDSKSAKHCMAIWKEFRPQWGNSASTALQLLLDGIVLTPLLTSITYYGFWNGEGFSYKKLDAASKETMSEIFQELGVGSINSHGNLTMTTSGNDALKRCYAFFIPTSFNPMLSNFNHIMYKEPSWGFVGTSKELARTPIHVQSLVSVINSGLPHLNLFNEMMHHISIAFNGEEFASQPTYIADAGSGDGYLLLHAYDFIKNKTPRGKVLNKFPLTMIGIESDEDAMTLLKLKLSQKGIPSLVLIGNVGNPAGIISQLKQKSIDPSRVLHVRAFVDHDRPYEPPKSQVPDRDSAVAAFVKQIFADITHLDKNGLPLNGLDLFCSFVEHISRWAAVLEGTHGLCLLEEMMLNVGTTKEYMTRSVAFHVDIVQSLSRHHLIPPAAFAMGAAMAGLLPTSFKEVRVYPEHARYCRVVNVHLVKRPFHIRLAEQSDMPSLLRLEALAWEKHMQASREILLARLTTSPTTNIVCVVDGTVVGVLYMQRIPSLDTTSRQKFMRISETHDPNGSIIQLIAVNVDPMHKTMGIGSELRAFALYLARVEASITSVCAVTLCRDFSNFKGSMQAYLEKHVAGKLHDPIVGFHTGYGAVFQRLVPNFRPEDTDNRGTGVLIQYQISDMERLGSSAKKSRKPESGEQKVPSIHMLKPIFSKCGYEINDDNMDQGFFGEMGFGLDSLDSVHVVNELSSKIGQELQTTLLFDYPTARSLCQQLDVIRKVDNHVSVLRLPKSGDDPFVRQVSNESAITVVSEAANIKTGRSPSLDSSHSKLAGQVRSWDKMSARELLEMQNEIRKVLAQPKIQARFSEVARKCYPDFMKYTRDIEPILCDVEGPVMLRHGYIEDDSHEVVQKNRPLFFSRVFLKYCNKNAEVKRLGAELVKLTGQDQNWPNSWSEDVDEARKFFGSMMSRKRA